MSGLYVAVREGSDRIGACNPNGWGVIAQLGGGVREVRGELGFLGVTLLPISHDEGDQRAYASGNCGGVCEPVLPGHRLDVPYVPGATCGPPAQPRSADAHS